MKTKISDIHYCNVSKTRIGNANPTLNKKNLKLLEYWIQERYKIHIKKDIQKQTPPWTTDKILQKYKFCNVKREHDKESKWLIKNISINNKINYEDKILNTILFRLINKSQTTQTFQPLNFKKINIEQIRKELKQFKPNYIYFSNAFFMSGQKTAANKLSPTENNMIIKIIKLIQYYQKQNIVNKIKQCESQNQVYLTLKQQNGLGYFLSYQIFVDLTYIKEFPFSENEFVISGPGCIKGLDLIFNNYNNLSYDEALFYLRDNQKRIFKLNNLFKELPKHDKLLNIMSLENIMCEFSKYHRTENKLGRPKILYRYQ